MARKSKSVNGEAASAGNESPGSAEIVPENGNTNNGIAGANSEIAETDGNGGEPAKPENDAPIVQKKRGRKPLTAEERERRAQEKLDKVASESATIKPSGKTVSRLSKLYMTANNFGAMRANAQEFVIDEKDAETIAEPLAAVLAKWGISLDGGDNPYMQLAAAMIGVYGLRTVAFTMRRASEAPKPAQAPARAAPSNVTPFGQPVSKVDFSLNQERVG